MDLRNISAQLTAANKELAVQNLEKEKLAVALNLANAELDFQNKEKGKRAAELIIANIELDFQNEEKLKRARELIIANRELDFQNIEKAKRAEELIIANAELIFQNGEKEKRAAELIVANDELVFQSQEKEKRAVELITANRQKNEFFNMVSHEFKTPLTNIKAIHQILEKTTETTHKNHAFILNAGHNIRRLEKLVDDLLDVTKINSGEIELDKKSFYFLDALTNSLSHVHPGSGKHEITLQNSLDIYYTGDQARIEQVISNLLSNAIKYSPAPGQITVKAELLHGRVLVRVQDYGIGIEKKDIGHLFRRFFRVSETAMMYQGVGLGLHIAAEIVKAHHGTFTVESEIGKGSTFCFSLPLNQFYN